jgi:hypothetical protein
VTGSRRLSQAISEGDGISVIVPVETLDDVRAAEEEGAEAVAVGGTIDGLADTTTLPVLWVGEPDERDAQERCDAHALIVWAEAGDDRLREVHGALPRDMELVVGVANEEELELALELDAQIFLLSGAEADDDQHAIDRVLELLPDVPAGKLAIAEVDAESRDEVVALEAAGFDAVLVSPGHVADLVGGAPPQV